MTPSHAVVVVTGASAGVGRATARLFASCGASVAILARDAKALDETRAEIESIGGRALALPTDVADAKAVFEAAHRVERELGPISVWVNNAMLTVYAPVSETTPDEFRRVTETTYLGFVYGTMAALACMRPRRRGIIVQVGSALAYRGIPLQAAYCGAKHAIRGFTDALRSELMHERSGIDLTMVQLPAVNTPQFDWARNRLPRQPRPVAPVIQPEVAAHAILKAAIGRQREYWLGFSTIKAILANMIAPGMLDRYLARTAYRAEQRRVLADPAKPDNLDTPVTALHRTRGSFGAESHSRAMLASEGEARLLFSAAGLGAIALLGRAIYRGSRRMR